MRGHLRWKGRFLAGTGLAFLVIPLLLAVLFWQVAEHADGAEAALLSSLPGWLLVFVLACGAWLLGLGLGLGRAAAGAAREERDAAFQREVERITSTDPATGLLTPRGLAAVYEEWRALLAERDLVLNLFTVDVERMEQYRDMEGEEAGDMLLARLAACLRAHLREEDAVARLERDTLLLILPAPRYSRPGEAVARRLQDAAAAERELGILGAPVTLSIGLTGVSRAETRLSEALKAAELARRTAREEGQGAVAVFHPALRGEHDRRNGVLREVASALEEGRIVPLYQPIVSLGDHRIVAFEALARLQGPDGELVEPSLFRSALADPHLSSRISEHIFAQAVRDVGQLRREGLDFGRVAVNVTETQVADPGFAERVLDELMVEGLSPHDLSIEVTERIVLPRREHRILATLESLAAAGVELAFDDFGTGYASFDHLRSYPVKTLKLEGAFVREIAADAAVRSISRAVLDIAHATKRRVVAEGVETAAVDAQLRELGCDCAQGFYYCRPVPLSRVERLARKGLAA